MFFLATSLLNRRKLVSNRMFNAPGKRATKTWIDLKFAAGRLARAKRYPTKKTINAPFHAGCFTACELIAIPINI